MRILVAKLSLLIVSTLSSVSLQAQETIISIGTPESRVEDNLFIQRIASDSLSTAQVDAVLRNVAPSIFGQNFTRDRANKVFADFANFRTSLASSLAQTIASQPNIRRVNSVAVNTNALNLRLSQNTNSVSGELGSVMASVSLVSNNRGILGALFCPSANVRFNVNNIKASGDYNYISGDLNSAAITYDLTDVSASCNGLLGFILNAFGIPSARARSQINSEIQSQINTQLSFVNMKRLFSLADFANGLHRFRTETPVTVIANRAIGVFQEIVNDAAINTPGIVLDVGVQLASAAGGLNKISFVASHAPIDVTHILPIDGATSTLIFLKGPPNTGQVDIYGVFGGQNGYLGTTVSGSLWYPGQIAGGSEIIAVGRSSIIPGLESLPGLSEFAPDPSATLQ